MKPYTSLHLKTAVMAFYRFKKQMVCADEVSICGGDADVLVDSGTSIFEIECKVTKSDLKADLKKKKHEIYKEGHHPYLVVPTRFYICVPTPLVEDAKIWVEEVNPKYGVIEFSTVKYEQNRPYRRRWDMMLYFVKKAGKLTDVYHSKKDAIAKRLCSANLNFKLDSIYEGEL